MSKPAKGRIAELANASASQDDDGDGDGSLFGDGNE
jgi:hypothetical protein